MAWSDPNISYYTQVQQNLAPGQNTQGIQGATGQGSGWGYSGGQPPASATPQTVSAAIAAENAPALATQGLQEAGIQQQLGDLGPQLALEGDYATQMAGYQLGGLGINTQQTGLQQQGTQQAYGIQQQQFGIQQQQQALNFQNQMQGIIGGEAASGALNTQGSKQQQSTAQQQYGFGQQQLGLNEQLSAGDYARAQQNYGLIGQANGLAQQEVYTRLQNGLQQMGVGADPTSLVSQAGGVLGGEASGVGSTLSQAGLLGGSTPSRDWGDMGLWDDLVQTVEAVPSTVKTWGEDIGAVGSATGDALGLGGADQTPTRTGAGISSPADSVPSPGTPGAPPGAVPAVAPTTTTGQQDITSETDIANKAMDSLLTQYASAMGQVDPYISGSMGTQAASQAQQIGQAIGGSGVQAPAGNAKLTSDAQAFQQANDAGAGGVASALGNLRQADAQALAVSPYTGLLTALTSGATYRAETAPTPGAAGPQGMPAWLADAYNTAVTSYGLSSGAQGAQVPGAPGSQGGTQATTPPTDSSGPGGSGGPG